VNAQKKPCFLWKLPGNSGFSLQIAQIALVFCERKTRRPYFIAMALLSPAVSAPTGCDNLMIDAADPFARAARRVSQPITRRCDGRRRRAPRPIGPMVTGSQAAR